MNKTELVTRQVLSLPREKGGWGFPCVDGTPALLQLKTMLMILHEAENPARSLALYFVGHSRRDLGVDLTGPSGACAETPPPAYWKALQLYRRLVEQAPQLDITTTPASRLAQALLEPQLTPVQIGLSDSFPWDARSRTVRQERPQTIESFREPLLHIRYGRMDHSEAEPSDCCEASSKLRSVRPHDGPQGMLPAIRSKQMESCDDEDVKFELVSGKYMTDRPMKSSQTSSAHECLNLCRGEPKCRSVSYDYRRRLCHAHSDTLRTGADTNVKNDPQMNYFEKVCISTGNVCDKYWAFERVPGKELALGAATSKVIVEANTREECQAACLAHRDFLCHSAEFNYQLSECRLSPYSRFTSPAAEAKLEDSKFVVDYFENNCFKEIRGFCNTKKYRDQELVLADLIIGTQSQEDCLQRCLHSGDFVCRSFSFERETQTCFLSHHTRKSAPDGATLRLPGTDLVELGACFDVFVDCEPQVMKARVKSNMVFKGKVYARGRPTTCSQDISSSMDFTLPIQLSGSDCGTISKTEGHFSNVLVIQSNDQVVTAMDKAIGVSCTFDVGNKTEFAAAKVSDPKQTDRSRGKPPLPELSLHILDMRGNERDSVSLGELVRVQVRMSEEDTYGIFVKNLIARDGTGSTNLTLIDKTGCPVEAKMMREIRTIDSQSKSLESYLEAFAFTGSSTLELEAEVVTCLERCKPVLCQIPTGRREDDIETVTSFGRRRRSADDDHLSEEEELTRTTLSKKVSIVANEFGVGRQTQDISYAFPVTAPTTSGKTSSMEDLIAEQLGVVCFEPTTSAVIGGLALFLEVFGFSTCLVFALRRRKDSTKDEPICYDNSIEGSTDFPSSAPY
ncbi:uncharacterized protein ISCGN_010877 [Ixodes scapularis]